MAPRVADAAIFNHSTFYIYARAEIPVHNNPLLSLQPSGDIAGVKVRNGQGLCQGGKPGTGELCNDVCLCGSAHPSGCVVDGLSATAAY